MRKSSLLVIISLIALDLFCQIDEKDSLLALLHSGKRDTARVHHLIALANLHNQNLEPDSALFYAYKGIELSKEISYQKGEIASSEILGWTSWNLGNYPVSIKCAPVIIDYAKAMHDTAQWMDAVALLSNSYRDQGEFEDARKSYSNFLALAKTWNNCEFCGVAYAAIGSVYYGLEKYDSALFFIEKGLSYPEGFAYGWMLMMAGKTMSKLHKEDKAFAYLRKSLNPLEERPNFKDLTSAYSNLSFLFNASGQIDSAIFYGHKAVSMAKEYGFNKELLEGYEALSQVYEEIDPAKALNFYKLSASVRNTIYNQEKQRQITSFKFNEIFKENEIRAAQSAARNQLRQNALLGSLFTLIVVAFLLFRNSKNQKKAKQKIENAYDHLRATQSQLIHSEKMASLGELTAGIAHEIQNPLNFVNNFSDVNQELLDELSESIKMQNWMEVEEILQNLKKNENKVMHHGRRAEEIVRSMLLHSRGNEGEKESTDINALCDEYLRLAYHGFRARDKFFNVHHELDLDESLPQIEVVPQDIGRVLLNLINNAFQAVAGVQQPKVTVSTKKLNDEIIIIVKDNGPGIPNGIRDKIFQPFFTTKPTGQGTGLGLSLAYDIVKAHGGELLVETEKSAGSKFIIKMPI